MDALHGYPPCPVCDQQLKLRSMPDFGETYWHCATCGTEWGTPDLIEALEQNEEIEILAELRRLDWEV